MRKGIIVADALVGLALLAIAAVVLVTATTRTNRAVSQLSDSRRAARIAEATLCDLQAGLAPKQQDSETKLSVEPCEGGVSVSGRHWVQVIVTVRGQSRLLVGLVPDRQPTGGGR